MHHVFTQPRPIAENSRIENQDGFVRNDFLACNPMKSRFTVTECVINY